MLTSNLNPEQEMEARRKQRRSSTLNLLRKDRYIFERAMEDDWDEVVEKYTGEDRRLKVTRLGETALHLAVKSGKTEHVRKMVEKIDDDEEEAFEILSLKDVRGNTALHMAAGLGNVAMCCCLAIKNRRLLALRNLVEATPLYVSVANGKKEAFFHLDFIIQESRLTSGQAIDYSLYTRKDGYTILHSAVFREYFGLAIQIVEIYPNLVNFVDHSGWSPLHILATKYAAFRRASFLGQIDRLLLRFINVEQLVEKEKGKPMVYRQFLRTEGENHGNHQQNYQTEPGDIENHIPLENSYSQGNEKMIKIYCHALLSILFKTIPAFIWYLVRFFVKTFLKMAGIGWLDIPNLIKYGLQKRKNLREKEIRWRLAEILLEILVFYSSMYMNDNDDPFASPPQTDQDGAAKKQPDSPFLLAARHGVIEVVDIILHNFPMAAFDLDSELKNAAMLAAEKKRAELYNFLLYKYPQAMDRMMVQLDKQGNSVLHHCATFQNQIVLIYTPEPASFLRSQYSCYKVVKRKMPADFLHLHNSKGLTPQEVFMKSYEELIKSGTEWLVKCSETCSVVAALIATVAFTTSAVNNSTPDIDDSNNHIFIGVSLFDLYSFFALLALCFSLLSLLYFIAIRTSSFRVKDFSKSLPRKLFLGLMFLLLSMVSIFTSFCFIHHSKLNNDTMRHASIPIYILAGVRLLSFAVSQLPFYHGAFFRSKFGEPI